MMTLKWILRIIRTCILGFRQDRLQVPASRQSKLSSIPKIGLPLFVADKDGYHRFTKTYEEHKAMIRAIHGDVDI